MPKSLQKIKTHNRPLLIILCVIILGIGGWFVYDHNKTHLTILEPTGDSLGESTYHVSNSYARKILQDINKLKTSNMCHDQSSSSNTAVETSLVGYIGTTLKFTHPNVTYDYIFCVSSNKSNKIYAPSTQLDKDIAAAIKQH